MDEWYNAWDYTSLSDVWEGTKHSITHNFNLHLATSAATELYEIYDHTYSYVMQKSQDLATHNYSETLVPSGAGIVPSPSIFAKDTGGNNNVTEWRRSIARASIAAERAKFLGPKSVKVGPGKWRSADGLRQFRLKPQDFFGLHPIGNPSVHNIPHAHFEFLRPLSNKFRVIKNIHVPIEL